MNDTCGLANVPPSKDKRTLVLFLLGFMLLSLSLLPQTQEMDSPHYAMTQSGDSERWHLVSVPRTEAPQTATSRPHDYAGLRSFDDAGMVPPELALFVNRPLSLNHCRAEDLQLLPGIGPKVAAAIITTRNAKGRFNGPNDLLDVPGIGPKNIERILPLVSFVQ